MIIEEITSDDEQKKVNIVRLRIPQRVVESRRILLGYIRHTSSKSLFPGYSLKPITSFLCTSEEGKQLMQGNWGFFDPKLSFLDCNVDVVASSNGFLLCQASLQHHMDFIVCNPVTRQFRRLPKAKRPYSCAPVAFICRGDCVTSLEEVEFEVIRAGVPNASKRVSSVLIETFSSRTNTWDETWVVSDSAFILHVHISFGPFVSGEVIFWSTQDHQLLVFDRPKEVGARLILPPPRWDGRDFVCKTDLYGISQGKVHYARYGHECLELWVLDHGEDDGFYGWVIKHRVRSSEISTSHGMTSGNGISLFIQIRAFHPQNSDMILLTLGLIPHWYNLRSKQRMEIIFAFTPLSTKFFPYEWPLYPTH